MGSAEGPSMWRCEMIKIPRVVYVGILMVRLEPVAYSRRSGGVKAA